MLFGFEPTCVYIPTYLILQYFHIATFEQQTRDTIFDFVGSKVIQYIPIKSL